ncbi:MAG: phosphoenolpyruvate--protein phosphotransferase [Candidatus Latescibacterota bacterium]
MTPAGRYLKLAGISACPGVAIGRALVYRKELPLVGRRRVTPDQVEDEVERFLKGIHLAAEGIRRTRRLVAADQGEELAQIFDVQLAMLDDVAVKDATLSLIREELYSAERAYAQTLEKLKEGFSLIENEYMRQRVSDVVDVEHQVLSRLAGGELPRLKSLRAHTIVVAHDLLPSESVHLNHRQVKGLVLDVGGSTSHTAIIARSLDLPTVLGAEDCSRQVATGDLVIVDGNEGQVHVRPGAALVRRYRSELRRQQQRERDLSTRRSLPAVTHDGHAVELLANIDALPEVDVALANGCRGVGMYRTEFLYLDYKLPEEEEQLEVYGALVRAMAPRPVVIRTMDLGGDKLAQVLDAAPESNPFLGWRGIRVCLDTPGLFKTQLRALLRAAVDGDLRILLPMISGLEEVRQVRVLLEETRAELRAAGLPFRAECPLGVMIEVPSAALMTEELAAEADFLSLGTNDLTQYTLAVDRGTASVAKRYEPLHPAVLRLIRMVAEGGSRRETPVSICGEMAGDPLVTALLLGLGVMSLSMSPGRVPEVKEAIRATTLPEARRLAEHCLALSTGAAVRSCLEERCRPRPSRRKSPRRATAATQTTHRPTRS